MNAEVSCGHIWRWKGNAWIFNIIDTERHSFSTFSTEWAQENDVEDENEKSNNTKKNWNRKFHIVCAETLRGFISQHFDYDHWLRERETYNSTKQEKCLLYMCRLQECAYVERCFKHTVELKHTKTQ